jgi:hypothetical protein
VGGSDATYPEFSVKGELESNQVKLEFASRYILEQIGIEIEDTDESFLDRMLREFPDGFPTTRTFSDFARSTVRGVSPADDPDELIMAYMEREEVLFRTLERHLIGDRLQNGFADTDTFIKFSLSVQNRRKSRAGSALENHVEHLFLNGGVQYTRAALTEGRSRPDFLFPGESEYRNPAFPDSRLTMLGVKSSCKDRWRQLLAEAARISPKHLLTLEPGISQNQTDEMRAQNVQLVVPRRLHTTLTASQHRWLMTLADFICLVQQRQA